MTNSSTNREDGDSLRLAMKKSAPHLCVWYLSRIKAEERGIALIWHSSISNTPKIRTWLQVIFDLIGDQPVQKGFTDAVYKRFQTVDCASYMRRVIGNGGWQ